MNDSTGFPDGGSAPDLDGGGGPPSPLRAPPGSLKGQAVRASLWSALGYGGAMVLRLAGNVILARLLFEEAFGIILLVAVFMQGLEMFSDIGIRPGIIQSPNGTRPDYLNTAWTIQIVRGGVIGFAACLLAWPYASFYDRPSLVAFILVTSLSPLIQGFYSTKLYTLNRDLNLPLLVRVQILSQLVSLVVMTSWAYFHRSPWAIVVGGISNVLCQAAFSHRLLPGLKNRWQWHPEYGQEVLRFGRWIFVSSGLSFFAFQADKLIFGKLVSDTLLGVYAIAFTLTNSAAVALIHLVDTVVFPVYSRVRTESGDLRSIYTRARRPILSLAGYGATGLICAGPSFIYVLYDERYHGAAWMVQILGLKTWLSVIQATNLVALLASGESRATAICSAAKLVGVATLIPLGYHYGEFPGAVVGFAAAELLYYGTSAILVLSLGRRGLVQDLFYTAYGGIVVVTGAGVSRALEGLPPIVELAVMIAMVTLFWLPFGLSHYRESRVSDEEEGESTPDEEEPVAPERAGRDGA